MENYIDYKATVWFRIPIEEVDKIEEIVKTLEKIKRPAELYDTSFFENEEIGLCHIAFDTEVFLEPNDNGGDPTIEVFKNDELIWDNSERSKISRNQNIIVTPFKEGDSFFFIEGNIILEDYWTDFSKENYYKNPELYFRSKDEALIKLKKLHNYK